MAYKRRHHKRKTHHRKPLSKRLVRAIKAISQKPVETKDNPYFQTIITYLGLAGYISGAQAAIRHNIYSDIPRADNALTREEHEFNGTQINSRGLRWVFNCWVGGVTPGNLADVQFRFTVYSEDTYFANITGPGPSAPIFDQEQETTATWATWNPQRVKIHYQRRFKMDNNGNTNAMVSKKFYVPLRRKITAATDSNLVSNTYMGEVKGLQTYWVLEMFSPGLIPDLTQYLNGTISWKIYYKDP